MKMSTAQLRQLAIQAMAERTHALRDLRRKRDEMTHDDYNKRLNAIASKVIDVNHYLNFEACKTFDGETYFKWTINGRRVTEGSAQDYLDRIPEKITIEAGKLRVVRSKVA